MINDNAVGVIIFKKFGDEVKYLILKAHKWGTFPKGHIDAGETKRKAALRELYEETGIKEEDIKLISDEILLTQEYFFNDKKKGLIKKTNEFYIAEALNDKVVIDNDEISEYRWCRVKEAIEISEYKNFNETLIEADEIIKKILKL